MKEQVRPDPGAFGLIIPIVEYFHCSDVPRYIDRMQQAMRSTLVCKQRKYKLLLLVVVVVVVVVALLVQLLVLLLCYHLHYY